MVATASLARPRPTIGRTLLVGLGAGLLAGVANLVVAFAYGAVTGRSWPEVMGPAQIVSSSLLLTLIGAFVYWLLSRFTARATAIFVVLGLAFATLYSIAVLANEATLVPQGPAGIGVLATIMHYVAAAIALYMIPRFSRS